MLFRSVQNTCSTCFKHYLSPSESATSQTSWIRDHNLSRQRLLLLITVDLYYNLLIRNCIISIFVSQCSHLGFVSNNSCVLIGSYFMINWRMDTLAIFVSLFYKTNKFHVAECPLSRWAITLCARFLFLPHFDVILINH